MSIVSFTEKNNSVILGLLFIPHYQYPEILASANYAADPWDVEMSSVNDANSFIPWVDIFMCAGIRTSNALWFNKVIWSYGTVYATASHIVTNILEFDYRKTSNIRRILVGNKIVDHSDVVGASHVGAAPTTSSFST